MAAIPTKWGGGAQLSPAEALMWRAEGNLHTRGSGSLLEVLNSTPDWSRFLAAHDRATQTIPRFRDRVVEPLPFMEPLWSRDNNFELDYHVQRVRLPAPGSMRQLLDLAAYLTARPLDRNRPPWEATLIEGLESGQAGYLLKFNHALTDGLGLIQLLNMGHSKRAAPGGSPMLEVPVDPRQHEILTTRQDTAVRLAAQAAQDSIAAAPARLVGVGISALRVGLRLAGNPGAAAKQMAEYTLSLRRVLSPAGNRSPALTGRGFRYHVVVHDVALSDLKAAGKRAGASVNDAFLAGILGAFRLYHERIGQAVDVVRIGLAVSLRNAGDNPGGNRFGGGCIAGPAGEADPLRRIERVREAVLRLRGEPALGFTETLAPVLSRLPHTVLATLASELTNVSDVQVSNIPGPQDPVFLAGARVERMYGIGPRPGVVAMTVLTSYNGVCGVSINLDPDAITDVALFETCLQQGIDEVIGLIPGHQSKRSVTSERRHTRTGVAPSAANRPAPTQ